MEFIFSSIIIGLVILTIILLIVLLSKVKQNESTIINSKLLDYEKKLDSYEKNLKDEFERNRKENQERNCKRNETGNEEIRDTAGVRRIVEADRDTVRSCARN